MAISPISSVSFNNYTFGSRRNRENYSTVPIRTAALTAMLAAAPMADVADIFAIEPQKPKTEVVANLNSTQQDQFVPLPAGCKVLKDIHLEYPDGDYIGFKLISTDSDNSNYEMVEFSEVSTDGMIINRGILKAITINPAVNGKTDVRLYGIELSKKDANNYAPKNVIMRVFFPRVSSDFANIFRNLINNPDNRAVNEMSIKDNYSASYRYPTDLKIYKRILGID